VLRPGGRLAVFWYVFGAPPPWAAAFATVYRRLLPDSPFSNGTTSSLDAYSASFVKAEDGMRQVRAFGEPERWRFDWDRTDSRDEWLDVVPTSGGHSQFAPGILEALLAGIGAAIDAVGGGFTMRHTAVVGTASRIPTA